MPTTDIPTLWEALAALQAEIPRIVKSDDAQIGTRPTKYASLATITDAVRPLLAKHGFAWVCLPTMAVRQLVTADDRFVLHYRLLHAPTGESIEGDYPLPSGNPQTMGGAITYARRYALCAVLNITPAEDDDDAEQATREQQERQRERSFAIGQERAASPPPHTRPADRSKGPMDDDPWAIREPGPEDQPGAVGKDERLRNRLHAAFGRAKISGRADRLAYAMSKLDLPELTTSNNLSVRDALQLIAHLNAETED